MAEAVSLQLKQLFSHLKGVNQLPTRKAIDKRIVVESFDCLENNLKEMMLGYENEKVPDLFKQLQGKLARILRYQEQSMEKMLNICEKLGNKIYLKHRDGRSCCELG